MEDFEKLGALYLGRLYDLANKKPSDGLLLYDSKDLVTHAVCVGMTGSGKTGLCIGLIEEAAIDGVPSILIDPKGDLGNLLLTFPQLRGEDFLPWINLDDARKKDLSAEDYAQQQAELWKKGIAGWGQSGERIQRLRDAADFAIYTPGSNAGLPVSILKSFAAPDQAIMDDEELMRDRINTTVTSLLGLVGIEADPVQSREHILLSTIFDLAWRQGQDLDLAALIEQVQTPPVSKVGVLDLESFYSAKDRFELVMALNNLLASPGFNAWLEGEALDIGQILYTPAGKPRVAIFSIAHLSDAERMFFVSLLLNQVLGWMRSQPGTNSLRAIVYMDEIFGYLPPVGNPPSKTPLLTLLKQARAFGVGIVLATQNPVDLDYKALSNAGTWFIGRLQTERDKARLLDGLEGAGVTSDTHLDRKTIEKTLARLDSRVFLINNVHEDAPEIFHTRWVLSYLRGPLTRDQIKRLMKPQKATRTKPAAEPSAPAPTKAVPAASPAGPAASQPPTLPSSVSMYFIPALGSATKKRTLVYEPRILGVAKVRFADTKAKLDVSRDVTFITPVTDEAIAVSWEDALDADIPASDLEKSASGEAQYTDLPPAAGKATSYTGWKRDFTTWLFESQELELLRSPSLSVVSEPEETERDFRIRLQQTAREHRDEAVEKLRKTYAPKIEKIEDRIGRALDAVDREKAQSREQQLETAVSLGSTLLGAFTGRKLLSQTNLNRASSTARRAGRSSKEQRDVARAKESLKELQKELADLEAEFKAATEALEAKIDPQTEDLETMVIKPKKTYISVQLIALVWEPFWHDAKGNVTSAWQ